MDNSDAVYSRRPWDALPTTVQSTNVPGVGPNPSNEERLTSDSMIAALTNSGVFPYSPRNLFPERFGFTQTVLDIEDILNIDDIYRPVGMADFSGTPAGFAGGNTSPSYVNTLGNA